MAEFGLPEASLKTVRAILAGCAQVEKAIIYGSRAKGTHKPGSDIDLTLIGPELNQTLLARLAGALDESSIPYQVDLSIFATLDHPALREHIQRVGQVFYDRNSAG